MILNGGKIVLRRSVSGDSRYPSRWLGLPEETSFRTMEDQNGMAESLTDLLDSFEARRQPVSSMESAMRTQRIMEAVLKATSR